jgi:ribosomal subunit interface protein
MQLPLQITFHGISPSAAIEAAIREKAAKLEQFHHRIMSCAVVVEIPGRHKQKGKEFVVRIDLKVPGGEIVVNHDHHEDVYVALRTAFDAARRKLEDMLRRQRGEVKSHEPEFTGQVSGRGNHPAD